MYPRLYKIQLEYAQSEINRAQAVLEAVDKQRAAAEQQAADARSKARRLNEELLVEQARRQGRRQGMQEGLQRGRTLAGADLARPMAGQRSSYLDAASFMDDESNSDGDNRTLSAPSLRSSRQSERPVSTAETEPVPSSSSRQSTPPTVVPPPYVRPPSQPQYQPEPPRDAPSSAQGFPFPDQRSEYQRSEYQRSEYQRSEYQPSHHQPSVHQSSRPHSRAQSVAQSEAPPPSFRNPSPVPRSPNFIPPDNFIPLLDGDGLVRLPPPHEFHRPITPDVSSPVRYDDGQHRRQMSNDSSFTLASQYSHYDHPPPPTAPPMEHHPGEPRLSVIPEVSSIMNTPNTMEGYGHDLRSHRSMVCINLTPFLLSG